MQQGCESGRWSLNLGASTGARWSETTEAQRNQTRWFKAVTSTYTHAAPVYRALSHGFRWFLVTSDHSTACVRCTMAWCQQHSFAVSECICAIVYGRQPRYTTAHAHFLAQQVYKSSLRMRSVSYRSSCWNDCHSVPKPYMVRIHTPERKRLM